MLSSGGAIPIAVFSDREAGEDGREGRDPQYYSEFIMGHFEDIDTSWEMMLCKHPEHEPPSHICIPQGKVYVHECPACGATTRLMPPQHTL
jgi:hypothetical protein